VLTKSLGSSNANNMVHATMDALKKIKRVEDVARLRGRTVQDLLG
jgi:small subunit ribosomal protein S5